LKRKVAQLVLGIAAVLTLAIVGVGAASAQNSSNTADTVYDRFVSRVAQLLGKQPAQVKSAMTQASKEQVDQAVKDGDLTQEQADAIKNRIDESGRPFPFFGHHPGGRFGPHGSGVFGEVTKVSGSTLTVKTPDGTSKTVKLTSQTEIRNEGQEATASAIKVGSQVRVIGDADSNGAVTADAVLIGEPGGFGRHRGHWGDGPDQSDDSPPANGQ
jgi:hypothetical protein